MPIEVYAFIAGLAIGYFNGRLKRIRVHDDRIYDLEERVRVWRGAFEMQRDHAPRFPRFSSGAPFKSTPVENDDGKTK